MSVVHFHRMPFAASHSIEELFTQIRKQMHIRGEQVQVATLPNLSKGLLPRINNLFWARRHRGEINHITGDIHYVAMTLPTSSTILTIHDCYPLVRLSGIRKMLLKLFWFEIPCRRARFVTVISEQTKSELLRLTSVKASKVHVIPDCISDVFKPAPTKSFSPEKPTLLQIGTKENKNLYRVVEAIAGLDCKLHVIGPVDDKLANHLLRHKVDWSSEQKLSMADVYDRYCQADVVLFASTYEGFGMPIVEAQCTERPVVTSNVSSMPEIAGEGACLVDPFNVDSIRNGILKVVRDPTYREQLVSAGQRNRERFTSDRIAEMYCTLYDQIRSRLPN